MTALGWFLLGVVAGFVVAMVVWAVKVGRMIAAAVKQADDESREDARVIARMLRQSQHERGGRVRVGER